MTDFWQVLDQVMVVHLMNCRWHSVDDPTYVSGKMVQKVLQLLYPVNIHNKSIINFNKV